MTAQLALTLPEWRDIPGYEGLYQVSDDAQVKALPKLALGRWGAYRHLPEHVMTQTRAAHGRLAVGLRRDGKSKTMAVHRLVALAFLTESYFDGAQVCHNDGDRDNNHVDNLRWDTKSANELDKLRHGTNPNARKTECPKGHPYSRENTRIGISSATRRPVRFCRTCSSEAYISRRDRLRREQLGRVAA